MVASRFFFIPPLFFKYIVHVDPFLHFFSVLNSDIQSFHISYRTHMYSPYYLLLILYSLDIVLSRYRTELSLKLHDMIFSLRQHSTCLGEPLRNTYSLIFSSETFI